MGEQNTSRLERIAAPPDGFSDGDLDAAVHVIEVFSRAKANKIAAKNRKVNR